MGFSPLHCPPPPSSASVCVDSSSGQIYAWASNAVCSARSQFEKKVSCRPDRSSSPDATKMNPVILYSVFVPIVLLVCWDSGGSMVNVAGQ